MASYPVMAATVMVRAHRVSVPPPPRHCVCVPSLRRPRPATTPRPRPIVSSMPSGVPGAVRHLVRAATLPQLCVWRVAQAAWFLVPPRRICAFAMAWHSPCFHLTLCSVLSACFSWQRTIFCGYCNVQLTFPMESALIQCPKCQGKQVRGEGLGCLCLVRTCLYGCVILHHHPCCSRASCWCLPHPRTRH